MKKLNNAKLLPIALIASILLFGTLLVFKIINVTSSGASLNNVISVVSLLVYLGATIAAFIKKPIVKQLLIFTPLLSLPLCIYSGGVFASSLITMLIYSIGLLMLYQIKIDGIPYWNIIMGETTDDTTLTDKIGDKFSKSTDSAVDEKAQRSLKIGNILVTICGVIMVAILVYARGKVDFHIQWNMFESWLCPILYIVGLCITIFDPIPEYTSWLVYKDPDTGKELGREKDYDIIEVMFNSFILPLLMRFVVYPLVAAAIIYYPIMVVLALLEVVVSILFVVAVAAIIPLYLILSKGILSFNNKGIFLKIIPVATISAIAIITLIWLQTTNNKFSSYFQGPQQATIEEVESVEADTSNIDSTTTK